MYTRSVVVDVERRARCEILSVRGIISVSFVCDSEMSFL